MPCPSFTKGGGCHSIGEALTVLHARRRLSIVVTDRMGRRNATGGHSKPTNATLLVSDKLFLSRVGCMGGLEWVLLPGVSWDPIIY